MAVLGVVHKVVQWGRVEVASYCIVSIVVVSSN